MVEEIAFESGWISDVEGLVTFELRRVYCILSCITHPSTYTPNFIEIKETFYGRTDVRTHIRMYAHTYRWTFETIKELT